MKLLSHLSVAFGVVMATLSLEHYGGREQKQKAAPNFYAIERAREAEFSRLREHYGSQDRFDEEAQYNRFKHWLKTWEPSVYPRGDLSHVLRIDQMVVKDRLTLLRKRKAGAALITTTLPSMCANWSELGPFNTPTGSMNWAKGTGQINQVTINAQNPLQMFVCSGAGGLYVSQNGGVTWTNGGTDHQLPYTSAADCVVSPSNSNTWFLADGYQPNYDGPEWNTSTGVYRTSNAGVTWDMIGSFPPASDWWGFQIHQLLVDPNNSNTVFAATSSGLFKTLNANAAPSAVTWTRLSSGAATGDPDDSDFFDVVFKPGSSTELYAFAGRRYGNHMLFSADGGATWIQMPGSSTLAPYERVALAVTPANSNLLYVVAVDSTVGSVSRLFRYDGSAWVDKGPISGTGSSQGVRLGYADAFAVSPTNQDDVFVGDLWSIARANASGNGFCAWTSVSGTVHADIHHLEFSPDGQTLFAATDGGLFKSTNNGVTFTSQNNGLAVATIMTLDTSKTDPGISICGMFDCGSNLLKSGSWSHVLGGDGLQGRLDSSNPLTMYASSQVGGINRSNDGGLSFPTYIGVPSPGLWNTFFSLGSGSPNEVFVAETNSRVFRSTNAGSTWTQIFNVNIGGSLCWSVHPAPSSPSHLYATFKGVNSFLLYKSTNALAASPTWANIPVPSPHWINSIDVDEQNANKFWICFGAKSGPNRIMMFDPGLNQFVDLDPNQVLPMTQLKTVVHRRGSNNGVYVATEKAGVYYHDETMTQGSWVVLVNPSTGLGLPNVDLGQMQINYQDDSLRVPTFGRGLWKTPIGTACANLTTGFNANIRDGADDTGLEPNPTANPVIWDSPDIWVRNSPDFQFSTDPPRYSNEGNHENPEYSSIGANTPWIYAKVRNLGSQSISGRVRFYWANASTTGLFWNQDWTEIFPSTLPDVSITGLMPGGSSVAKVQWTTMPAPSTSTGGHFCLLARFESDASTPDPIIGEQLSVAVGGNVVRSNNIAWKNVTAVDLAFNKTDTSSVFIGNATKASTTMRLVMQQDARAKEIAGVKFTVRFPATIVEKWIKSGRQGVGVMLRQGGRIEFLKPGAWMGGIKLGPRERHLVQVAIELDQKARLGPTGTRGVVDLIQYEERGGRKPIAVGGERYRLSIRPKRGKTPPRK